MATEPTAEQFRELARQGQDAYYALPPRALKLLHRNERSLWTDRRKPVADAHRWVDILFAHVLTDRTRTNQLGRAMAHARLDMIDKNRSS